MSRRLLLPVVALLVLTAGQGGRGVVGQSAPGRLTTVLADLAAAVPQEFGSGGAAPAARPLDVSRLTKSIRDAVRSRRLRLNDRGEAQVYLLLTDVSDDAMAALKASGVRVEIADEARRRVQARVPVTRLHDVASLPFVSHVRLPNYAFRRRVGSTTTEGDVIHRADITRKNFGLTGAGVRVGVISDGLKGLFARACLQCEGAEGGPIPLGDLPPATGRRTVFSGRLVSSSGGIDGRAFHEDGDLEARPPADCAFGGAGAEGTALLEIVHDLAPGAALAFANADTDLAFMQAVNALAADSDIVVDDLGFFGDAYDGTSGVSSNTAAALNNPANRIRAYVTSVGNAADQHYFGGFVGSGVDGRTVSGIPTAGRLHLFQAASDTTDVLALGPQPFNIISLAEGGQAIVFLSWDDPAGTSANNYDLFLVRDSTNAVVARSTDAQDGEEDPFEAIDFTNDGEPGLFRIVIQNVGDRAQPKSLNLFTLQPQCAAAGPLRLAPGRHERHNFNTATRSVSAQSDAGGTPVSVISVGAVCSASPAAAAVFPISAPNPSCEDRTNSTVEFFSSRGPTLDGRLKPDLVAIDGVSVTGAGGFPNPFFGTSAAAPHVAAQAALLLQAAPCLRTGIGSRAPDDARARVRELILTTARPLASAPDNVSGFGLADVFASIVRSLPERVGPTGLVIAGNTGTGALIDGEELGFMDPNACDVTTVRVTGGACATGKTGALACPFGTSAAVVEASSNGVAFSEPAALQITVTDFSVTTSGVSASVPAGQLVSSTVTVAAQGGLFAEDVSLSCAGLPPGATCVFAPGSVTPGSGAAQSAVTILTAAAGAFPGLKTRGSMVDMEGRVFRPGRIPIALAPLVLLLVVLLPLLARRAALARVAAVGAVLALAACDQIDQPGVPGSSLSPSSIDFGAQVTQTSSAERVVTITNDGSAPVAIRSVLALGDFGQTHLCGPLLAPRAGCGIRVRFTPTANGERNGRLVVVTDASSAPLVAELTGTGVAPAGGTPPGTYPIAITGTSGALTRTAVLTLTVQ